MSRRANLGVMSMAALLALGCGYTENEWQAQLAKYNQLAQKNQQLEAELGQARQRVQDLEKQLGDMGLQLQKAGSEANDLRAAVAAYKQRAELLERIKARFEALQAKLQKLTNLGLEVAIRHNKMVVSLPGDVLFASGSDALSKKGEEVLGKVAEVLRGDPSLVERYYQVAGHTDDQKLVRTAAEFKDNWGLSVMRARQVVVFLTGPVEKGNGGLEAKRWSAAGYGDTDPISDNSTPAGRGKNRRVELVLQPDVEEMLDLKSLI